jgi:FkbH-like protein
MMSSTRLPDLRREIDLAIAQGASAEARLRMDELWRLDPGLASAGFLLPRFEGLRRELNLQTYRLAILRSFTVEPLIPLLRTAAFAAGIDLELYVSEFNAHAQDLLDADSRLYSFAPDAVILATRTADVAPELWLDGARLTGEQAEAIPQRVTTQFRQWISAFRSRSKASVIVHGLEQPLAAASGILDRLSTHGQAAAIARLNDAIGTLTREFRGVYVLDYDSLVATHGRTSWHDERRWLTVRLPIAGSHLMDLVREWMRFVHPLTGKIAKALVVDLDNTLWGGIVGEDGFNGIRIGAEYPGAAFQHFQRALLDLHHRGILLAICSKNNPDDALEVIDRHPGMLVRREHFSAMRINWKDKAENLRELAAELNIGVDALAFVDDNPVERDLVRRRVPEVAVIDLPADPLRYVAALRACPIFERLALSTEDRQRADLYAAQQERADLERTVASREDFLRSLEQEAEVAPVTAATLARVAQLTQKTNQFNLTTRRYSEEEVDGMARRSGWTVLSIAVRDRYGDNGLVGVAITADADQVCEVDTFLLSCRVIARTVETALLSVIGDQARARGCRALRGVYIPTRKNAPCKDFYVSHGFTQVSTEGDSTVWELDLRDGRVVAAPEWIRLLVPQPAK